MYFYLGRISVIDKTKNNQIIADNIMEFDHPFDIALYENYEEIYNFLLNNGFAKKIGLLNRINFFDHSFVAKLSKDHDKSSRVCFFEDSPDLESWFIVSLINWTSFYNYFSKKKSPEHKINYILKEIIDKNTYDEFDKIYIEGIIQILLVSDIGSIKEDQFNQFKELFIDIEYENIPLTFPVLLEELRLIINAKSKKRALYYIKRLYKSITSKPKTKNHNNINLNRWKEYNHILTDSLWLMDRDNSGLHNAGYHGNFIPQIPRQMIARFTKPGDLVLDVFQGSGTTLIECIESGRNYLGLDINPDSITRCDQIIKESDPEKTKKLILSNICADSRYFDYFDYLDKNREMDSRAFNLVILHPPYHNIVKFTDLKEDLSNMTLNQFMDSFQGLVNRVAEKISSNGFMILVCSDIYIDSEVIPLGFRLSECIKNIKNTSEDGDFILKGVIVKNFGDTKGKRGKEDLWRYRALCGDFYYFKHEYIFVFQNKW